LRPRLIGCVRRGLSGFQSGIFCGDSDFDLLRLKGITPLLTFGFQPEIGECGLVDTCSYADDFTPPPTFVKGIIGYWETPGQSDEWKPARVSTLLDTDPAKD